jgi:hypothetical protein
MVESFFHSRQQSLDHTLQGWIAYHTDRLSGSNVENSQPEEPDIDQRTWFRALAEISDDNF